MKLWYVLIGAYLVLHIGIMTEYAARYGSTEFGRWLYALQWLIPTLMLGLLVPRIQKVLNVVANIKVGTSIGFVIIAICIVQYAVNEPGRWFAWSTLGLLVLLMLTIVNSQARLGNTNAFVTLLRLLWLWNNELLRRGGSTTTLDCSSVDCCVGTLSTWSAS